MCTVRVIKGTNQLSSTGQTENVLIHCCDDYLLIQPCKDALGCTTLADIIENGIKWIE